jgi:tetratricopeptide (TPR) repeat protein
LSGADERKLEKTYTENSEAYQLYLKGRYHWYRFPAKDFEKSRDYFQQAIDIDPSFALAYAGLADYYGFASAVGILPPNENWLKVEMAAKKAQELDESRGEAYNPLAAVRLYYYRDWTGAEQEFKRGIELSPNFAEIRHHYALRLVVFGGSEETLAQMKKALELEPFSLRYNRSLAMILYQMRDYDRAVEQYRKTLDLEPNDAFTHELLGNSYEQKGMQKEAAAEWNKAFMLTGDNESAMILERTSAASGFNAAVRALWQKKLERLNEKANRGEYVPAMNYALAYTRLADKEQSLAWLTKAEQERNAMIFDIKLDPIYDPLRDDPRFQDLMRRVGLPQ